MSEKKQLNQNELEQVSGGGPSGESKSEKWKSKVILGDRIDIYQTEQHIGEEIYIESDIGTSHFYIGTLTASWEDTSYRMVTVNCKIGSYPGEVKTIKLIAGTLFNNSIVYLVKGYK